jgi:hypothetical protein
VYKQTLRSVKLTTGKKGTKTELTGKGPLRRRRSALDCSATEEEEEGFRDFKNQTSYRGKLLMWGLLIRVLL